MPHQKVAYFSMEIMLETDIPTYAGGLGILAGDVLRSCADLHIPAVGISLVYSGDTFAQVIDPHGSQTFFRSDWQKLDQLTKLPTRIHITIANSDVVVGCWRYDMVGLDGFTVPIYLLDTNFIDNPQWLRDITLNLYSGNWDNRICQEILLGIGGIKMLRALGYTDVGAYHLNEGHTAFATLALLAENNYQDDAVRKLCIFTTHTPIPEGHDKFTYDHAYHFAGDYLPWHIKNLAGYDQLSMTQLASSLSHSSLAGSQKHQGVSKNLFPNISFNFVTNGIHHRTWTSPTMQNLFDRYIPTWITNPQSLTTAPQQLPDDRLWIHHQDAKSKLVRYVNAHLTARPNPSQSDMFDLNTLTISLARRPVAYKRPLLLYHDLERFVRIGAGKLQIVQCGKSHPDDDVSQNFVRQIIEISKKFKDVLRIIYLENYSPKIARILVSGSDVWLNTPKRPLEASGTSGMKAAINGCLNFSVMDGWWIEAFDMFPESGFTIGPKDGPVDDVTDANDLYTTLESHIIPLYYENRSKWLAKMKQSIALGSYFNTHRVVKEYNSKAWTHPGNP